MKFKKSFGLAFNMLVHSKLRSWLTIIGIVIGIAAVVAIVAISGGVEKSLEDTIGDLGFDVLYISPGGGAFGDQQSTSTTSLNQKDLTEKDVFALKSVPNVGYVMGTISGSADIKFETDTTTISITGVDEAIWSEISSDELKIGRKLIDSDRNSVVIGDGLANDVFDGIGLNQQVTIKGRTFKVVGILESGNSVYMPIDIARDVIDDEDLDDNAFNSISVKLEDAKDVESYSKTLENIEKKLMMNRGILNEDDKDFSIIDIKSVQESISEVMGMISLFLGAIAMISLLVGAVGIVNTMFTSVLEKTRDIGIMKSIGAQNKDIMMIFLFNSGLIGLVGGIGGAILGSVVSVIVNFLLSSGEGMQVSTLVTAKLIIFVLLFSIIIGMVAGAIPAYRASKLKPVDALRYE